MLGQIVLVPAMPLAAPARALAQTAADESISPPAAPPGGIVPDDPKPPLHHYATFSPSECIQKELSVP